MSAKQNAANRKTRAQQEARIRAAHAVSLQRANPSWSLTRAASEAHTTVATVRRHMPTAVTKDTRGRWRAKRGDRERFTMRLVTADRGVIAAMVGGSDKRALVGAHHAAIRRWLLYGDDTALAALEGKTVAGHVLQTDPAVIKELYRQGELSFLAIYALTR